MAWTDEDAQELRKEMSSEHDNMRREANKRFSPVYERKVEVSEAADQAKQLISAFWEQYNIEGHL